MRQKAPTEQASAVEIISKRGLVKVIAVNSSTKSYTANDTRRMALGAMKAETSDAEQTKVGFWTKRTLASASDAELAKLGLQRLEFE